MIFFRFVMAHPLPPDHEVDVQEIESVQPELAPAQQLPPLLKSPWKMSKRKKKLMR